MDAPTARATTGRAVRVGLAVAFVLVLVDQATKVMAEAWLVPGVFVPWLSEGIGWQLVYNDGAAFGLPLPSWVFPVVTVVVGVAVVRALPHLERMLPVVGYGMLLAGAVGNVVDRVLRTGDPGDPRWLHGHVVDFVAWGSFPRFNVADSAITVGLALLVLNLLLEDRSAPRQSPRMVDLGGRGGASPTVRVIPAVGAGDEAPPVLDLATGDGSSEDVSTPTT